MKVVLLPVCQQREKRVHGTLVKEERSPSGAGRVRKKRMRTKRQRRKRREKRRNQTLSANRRSAWI
jgi:hypothetical protein